MSVSLVESISAAAEPGSENPKILMPLIVVISPFRMVTLSMVSSNSNVFGESWFPATKHSQPVTAIAFYNHIF